jgi:glycosyltransferase 2 family protein
VTPSGATQTLPRVVPPGWRAVLGVVAAALLVVGVALLIARAAGFSEVWEEIRTADSRWFLVCLAAQALALSAYADVIRGAFAWRRRPDPGFALSARVLFAGVGATRVFAAAGVGAIATTFWCFSRAGFPSAVGIVRVLGLNALFYVSFGVAAWLAALATATGLWGDASLALTLPWLLLVPVCVVAGLLVTRSRRGEPTEPAGSLARRALASAIGALAWVREVLADRAGRRLLASSALYWAGTVACLWAALHSVGQTLPLPELVLAFAVAHTVMLLPLPLGGVGGVDAALTYALTAVGVPLAPALVAVGVYRLFSFWVPTIPALAALVLLRQTGRRLSALATT